MLILETLSRNWFIDAFRSIMYVIDWAIYSIISLSYNLIDEIAGLSLLSDDTFAKLSTRVYMLLGIFILFKTAFSLINMFLNPDTFNDAKVGGGKLVTKIITMLVLLISVPAIFTNMFRLQAIVINQNVIGNIVLGATSYANNVNQTAANAGNLVSGTTFRAFFQPNFKNADGTIDYKNCTTCSKIYSDKYISISEFGSIINASSDSKYLFNYTVLTSSIAGAIAAFLMLSFAFDIAIRSVKLTFLQLIAPIPIIASIDPKKGGETLKTWTSEVTSTFLDLFVRLLMIYFVIFIIAEIFGNGNLLTVWRYNEKGIAESTTLVSLGGVFLIIGLLYFAKSAPKLLYGLLGIKMPEGGMGLNPLKKMLGTPGLGKAVGGAIGAWDAKKHGKSLQAGFKRGAAAVPLGGGANTKLKDLRPNNEARKKARNDRNDANFRNEMGESLRQKGISALQDVNNTKENPKARENARQDFIKSEVFNGNEKVGAAFQTFTDKKNDKNAADKAYETISKQIQNGQRNVTDDNGNIVMGADGKPMDIFAAAESARTAVLRTGAAQEAAKSNFESELNAEPLLAAQYNSFEYSEKIEGKINFADSNEVKAKKDAQVEKDNEIKARAAAQEAADKVLNENSSNSPNTKPKTAADDKADWDDTRSGESARNSDPFSDEN